MGGAVGVPMYMPDEVQTMPNFDLKRFMGRWYGIVRTYNDKFRDDINNLKCITVTYAPPADGDQNRMDIIFEAVRVDRSRRRMTIKATGIFPDEEDKAKIAVQFPDDALRVGNNWVLDTDYETYALIYSRKWENDKLEHYAWILGRTPQFLPEVVDRLVPVMLSYGIEARHLIKENQNYD